jgi:hypothetical protein
MTGSGALDATKRTLTCSQIARHQLPAVGIAFALGLLAGPSLASPGARSCVSSRRSAAPALLGAVAMRSSGDMALGQTSDSRSDGGAIAPAMRPRRARHGCRKSNRFSSTGDRADPASLPAHVLSANRRSFLTWLGTFAPSDELSKAD